MFLSSGSRFSIFLLLSYSRSIQPTASSPHPLDTLTLEELSGAVDVARANAIKVMEGDRDDFIFSSVSLKPPNKYDLLPHFLADTEPAPGSIPRISHVCIFHRETMRVFEAEVNVSVPATPTLVGWEEMPYGLQPMTSLNEEGEQIPQVAIRDPAVQARFASLGVTNMSRVIGDAW